MNELKNRGVEDILLAVVDGLKGFPEAITSVFPETIVQTCIVHLLRNSMDFVPYKDRKAVATALKDIYRAVCQGRRGRSRRFRGRSMGPEIPRHRPELAPGMAGSHPFLRLSGRRSSDHLYNERHRSFEFQAAPGHPRARPFPQR